MSTSLTKGRLLLIVMQVVSAVLFIVHAGSHPVEFVSWAVPLALLLLIVVNSIWFSRFVSWIIFAGSFSCLMIVLSAFTMRWRLDPGFSAAPFYRTMAMYTAFVYVSLAQLKILGGAVPIWKKEK